MGNYTSDKKNTRFFAVKLSFSTDTDIIERLDAQENKQAYIKSLIRADIAAQEQPQAEKQPEE